MKIRIGGNEGVSHEHKEEIQVNFQGSMDLLISSILNDNNIEMKYFSNGLSKLMATNVCFYMKKKISIEDSEKQLITDKVRRIFK